MSNLINKIEGSIATSKSKLNEELDKLDFEAKQLARDFELDKKITGIYKELKDYLASLGTDDRKHNFSTGVFNLKETNKDQQNIISFKLNGNKFSLTLFDEGPSTLFGRHSHVGKLNLNNNSNHLLISIELAINDNYGGEQTPFEISMLDPGEWIEDFLDLYERIKRQKFQMTH